MLQIVMKTANMWEYKVGVTAIIVNFVFLKISNRYNTKLLHHQYLQNLKSMCSKLKFGHLSPGDDAHDASNNNISYQ